MTVRFAPPATSSTTASPSKATETTQIINMRNRTRYDILAQLINVTKAKPVRATPEEERQIRDMEEFEARSEEDRQRMAKVNEERKKEEAILTQARGEVDAMKET